MRADHNSLGHQRRLVEQKSEVHHKDVIQKLRR